ncbi:TPA: ImmA/IrrE family metallo-endopeptidase, partial [Bacillus paranthracis]
MITTNNIEQIVDGNRRILPSITSSIDMIKSKSLTAHIKPLEYIKNYLNENTNVILYPSKAKGYGGLVYYKNGRFYIHINTLQPKVYENFMWAHEFYHYYFEKEKIKNNELKTFVDNSFLDESERKPNLFASEILINSNVLREQFNFIQQEYSHESLENQILRLIPVLEVPYKAIVIKLVQDKLITIVEAKAVVDFKYKVNLPNDFDISYLQPSNVIKIDKLDSLIYKAKGVMNEEYLNSFIEKY